MKPPGPRSLDRGGKFDIFGKKSIAWMDGVGAARLGCGEDCCLVKI
jgi:hypothetical protein